MSKKVYLAGPMRGYDQLNYPAFDKGKALLEAKGWQVFSPADHDRELGFEDLRASFEWDLITILRDVDAIVMLPGWEHSTGVTRAELPVAQTIGLEVYEITCLLSGNIVQLTAEEVAERNPDFADAEQRHYDAGYDDGYADGQDSCDCD